MSRVPALAAGLVLLVVLLPAVSLETRAERLSLETRPGVTVALDLQAPANAPALVLLFEGGGGQMGGSHEGFAAITHGRLRGEGLASALLGAPSDQRGFMGGMHPRFRTSEAHVADIDKVVAQLKARTGLPVWILGVSLGTRSAAWYAARRPEAIDGVVLLSSSTANPKAKPVDAFPLRRISVPLLAIAHERDACSGTPPAGARRIVAAATASRAAEARFFSGGRNKGRQPCGLRTYHTFYGIEDEVVAAVAEFILAQTP
jgi:pimeloyl-ACP methyl ester carboxylesterase